MSKKDLKSSSYVPSWPSPEGYEFLFPKSDFEGLLADFGWTSIDLWVQHWLKRSGINLASTSWPSSTKHDWIWGLGISFLSDLERFLVVKDSKKLFGISGLPGCGKTSLGRWLEAAALDLDWPVSVISLDDFYLPSTEMDKAMAGNPWNVPRAIPGSHSIHVALRISLLLLWG